VFRYSLKDGRPATGLSLRVMGSVSLLFRVAGRTSRSQLVPINLVMRFDAAVASHFPVPIPASVESRKASCLPILSSTEARYRSRG
jgi:hypothetical protein